MSVDEGDVAYGVMLVPPSRRESEDALTNGFATTPAHINGDVVNGVPRRAPRELSASIPPPRSSNNSLADDDELLEEMKPTRVPREFSASIPPPRSSNNSLADDDELEEMKLQNEDLKFRIQQQAKEMQALKTLLKIATTEARDAEAKLQKFISERDHAMNEVDKERIWMSTQLSNSEQQILRLQNENISLLLTIREQKASQGQMLKELEQGRQRNLPVAEDLPVAAEVVEADCNQVDPAPSKSRFGSKRRAKKIEDKQLRLAFSTAQAYFAHKQQKQNEPHYVSSRPLTKEESSTSVTSSGGSNVPSSKGQADLLARHILEKKPVSYVKPFSKSSKNDLPLTLRDEIKLKKSEQKRQEALDAMLLLDQ